MVYSEPVDGHEVRIVGPHRIAMRGPQVRLVGGEPVSAWDRRTGGPIPRRRSRGGPVSPSRLRAAPPARAAPGLLHPAASGRASHRVRPARRRAGAAARAALASGGLVLGLLMLLCAPRAAGAGLPEHDAESAYAASPLERDLLRLFPGLVETQQCVVHFRPHSAAERHAATIAEAAAAVLADLRGRMKLEPGGKIHLFVYPSSVEMARLTGRSAGGALALGQALHVPVDDPALEPAVAQLLEPWWARAGGLLGGSLEEGRWYGVRITCRGERFALALDDGARVEARIEPGRGRLGLGVEEGRLAVRNLRVRELPADPEAEPAAPWLEPELEPELPGLWSRREGVREAVNYGRMSRARLAVPPLAHFEVRAEVRLAAGARAEFFFHEGEQGASRLVLGPGTLLLGGRPAVGPHPVLQEGFGEAYAALRSGRALEVEARALLERGLLVGIDHLRFGLPRDATQRARRRLQAAAFVLYLWQSRGLEEYRKLHFDTLLGTSTPLGPLADLEAAWHKHLRALPVEREAFAAAVRTLGLDVLEPAAAWRRVPAELGSGGWQPQGGGAWRSTRGVLVYEAEPGTPIGYAVAPLGLPARLAIAATVRFDAATRVKISVRGLEGRKTSAVVSTAGVELLGDDGTVAARRQTPLLPEREFDVVLVLAEGAGRVYLDGRLACEAASGLVRGPGRFAIEVDGSSASVREVAVREVR